MPGKRDVLIETMDRLIGEQGIRATGIDQVIAAAGVAKMTLYNNFRSKEELVLATIREHDERFRHAFVRDVEARATGARERLLAVFDAAEAWMRSDGFHGCFFVRSASEYPELDDAIHRAAAENKQLFREYLWSLAHEAGAAESKVLADQIWLLLEGAITAAFVCGDCDAVGHARDAGRLLIDHALA